MRKMLSTLLFAYLLQQRVSVRPVTVEAGLSTMEFNTCTDAGDLFDRRCLQRMRTKAYRYALFSKRAHRGIMYKAKRGTLSDRWTVRYFWLRGRTLSYYREPLQIQNLLNARASAQSVLSSLVPGHPQRASMLTKLRDIEADLNGRLKSVFQRSFELVPGRTRLVVPRPGATRATFRTPFVFQLQNPGGDCMTLCTETSDERRMWITCV